MKVIKMSSTLARIRRDVYITLTNGGFYNTHTSNYTEYLSCLSDVQIVFNGVLKAFRSKRIKILVESTMIEKGNEVNKS